MAPGVFHYVAIQGRGWTISWTAHSQSSSGRHTPWCEHKRTHMLDFQCRPPCRDVFTQTGYGQTNARGRMRLIDRRTKLVLFVGIWAIIIRRTLPAARTTPVLARMLARVLHPQCAPQTAVGRYSICMTRARRRWTSVSELPAPHRTAQHRTAPHSTAQHSTAHSGRRLFSDLELDRPLPLPRPWHLSLLLASASASASALDLPLSTVVLLLAALLPSTQ
jgi:hypothetical protein